MNTITAVAGVVEMLIEKAPDMWKATKYISPDLVVAATRKLSRKKINKHGNIEIILKIGKPNYDERAFIKVAQKAGEPFPIKKVQLRPVPVSKKR